jgi:geranylgeranyl diphosphate synthase type II
MVRYFSGLEVPLYPPQEKEDPFPSLPPLPERFEDWFLKKIQGFSLHPLLKEMYLYALFPGGKRFRARLVYLSGSFLNLPDSSLFPLMGAVEMAHTGALVLDDLPSMDAGVQRRGKPALYRVYGEDMGTLCGVGLMLDAFRLLSDLKGEEKRKLLLISEFGCAVGGEGMVSGQVGDLKDLTGNLTREEVLEIHRKKTGKLIRFSFLSPFLLVEREFPFFSSLLKFGDLLGVLYQMGDDLLDEKEGTGKDRGKDRKKFTFLRFQEEEPEELREALKVREGFPSPLKEVCGDLVRLVLFRRW